ncbi:MAG: phosphate signaling complex protein PhoU [Gammaproteobacteria bacterium]
MTHPHIVKAFDEELGVLMRYIRTMGDFAATQFADAVRALLKGDWSLAQRVIDQDRRIDGLRIELSTAAATVIARRQPMATDLDEVLATLRVAEDIERIGDLAKNIAKRATTVSSGQFSDDVVVRVEELAALASKLLAGALETFSLRDPEGALAVRRQDEQIDTLHTALFGELVARLSADPPQAIGLVHLLFCAKNIERIGDHATHIAEAAYQIVTGRKPQPERKKLDQSSTMASATPERPPAKPRRR